MLARIANRILPTYTRKPYINNIKSSSFFKEREEIFKNFSLTDKINTAIAHSKIEDAEIGFYKGIGFFRLGPGYELEAIEAFSAAIHLDSEKIYTESSKKYLAQLRK